MSTDQPVARPVEGVDESEWDKLVERGRTTGEVHADQVSHVLRHVELSETVLIDVQLAFSRAGIAIDDQLDHDDDDHDDTPVGLRREVVVENDADEQLLSRRRQRRTKKRGPKAEGGSADAVRMYLREIGQVDLLTVDDERRLAQLIEEGKIAAGLNQIVPLSFQVCC